MSISTESVTECLQSVLNVIDEFNQFKLVYKQQLEAFSNTTMETIKTCIEKQIGSTTLSEAIKNWPIYYRQYKDATIRKVAKELQLNAEFGMLNHETFKLELQLEQYQVMTKSIAHSLNDLNASIAKIII